MATPKNPRRVFLSYKRACLVKVKEIQDFLLKHANVSLNPRKTLQLESSQRALRDQFRRMEAAWDDMKADPANEHAFDEVEEWIDTAKEAMKTALLDSEEFLDSNGFQVPTTDLPQSVEACPQSTCKAK